MLTTHDGTRLAAAALIATLLGACMASPRNQQQLPAPNASFNWNGHVINPNETLTLKVKDQSDGSWDTRTTAVSGAGGTHDGTFLWHAYGATTSLRYGTSAGNRKYWRMLSNQGTQRRMGADLMTSSPTRGDLFTFDVGADACFNTQTSGYAAINNCHSPSSPVATLTASCGKPNQACCLAQTADLTRACDGGRTCDTSRLTCSIPSGGYLQPCDGDGGCSSDPLGLQCVQGQCRKAIHRAPLLLTKLVVHTCDKSGAGTADEIWASLGGEVFFLDHPGPDARRNQTDTWALTIPGINSVSDISALWLGATDGEDTWCFDRVDLIVNGTTVLSKNYGAQGITIQRINDPFFPTYAQFQVADTATIRAAIDAANPLQVCSLPPSFSYADMELMIGSMLGNVFAKSRAEWGPGDSRFDARWGDYRPIVSRVNGNTIKAAIKFRATAELEDLPDFDITGDIEIRASATCTMVRDATTSGGVTRFDNCDPTLNAPITVVKAVGIPDTGIPGVEDIVRWIADSKVRGEAVKAVSRFPDFKAYFEEAQAIACSFDDNNQFCDPSDNICTCPTISADTSAVSFSWMAMSSFPGVLCLR